MSIRESLGREERIALRDRLRAEVLRCAEQAPGAFVRAWQLALDEVVDSDDGRVHSTARSASSRPVELCVYLQAYVRELAYELALFTEQRDPESVGEALATIVAEAFACPAIAA